MSDKEVNVDIVLCCLFSIWIGNHIEQRSSLQWAKFEAESPSWTS